MSERCKSADDLVEAARQFLAKRKRRYWSDTRLAAEQMADFAATVVDARLALAVELLERIDENLAETGANASTLELFGYLKARILGEVSDDECEAS